MGVAWKLCENIDPKLGLENRVGSELGLENRAGSRQAERRKKSILCRKEQPGLTREVGSPGMTNRSACPNEI